MSAEPIMAFDGVSFAYDGADVLSDVRFTVARGDFASVIGPNGGGKSTLLRLALGLLTPRCGTIRVMGQSPHRSRARVGYLPQNVSFDRRFPIMVRDVVLMGRLGAGRGLGRWPRGDREAAQRALADVDLADFERRPFAALSGGQRQRVLIARALACEPELLLLDEPTSNLDIRVEDEIYALLSELNQRLTIVMVSHDVGFVSKYVDTAICANRTVHVHTRSELSGEVIRHLYGREVRAVHYQPKHRPPRENG